MGEWVCFRSDKDEMKVKENCSWRSRALRFLQALHCDTVSYRGWEVGSWHTRACPINYPGKALSPPASSTSSGVVSLFKCSTRGRVVGTLSKVLRKLNKVEQRRAWWEPWTKREVRPEKTSLALRLSEESPRLQLRLEKEAKNLDDYVQLCWPNLSMSWGSFSEVHPRAVNECCLNLVIGHGCVADESTPKVIQTIIQIFAPSTYPHASLTHVRPSFLFIHCWIIKHCLLLLW